MGVAPDHAGLAARRAALSGAEGALLFPKLVRFARACGVREADAEDAAQTALTKFWAGDWAWDPETHPDVPRFLMGMVRSVASNQRRSARRKYESPSDAVDESPDVSPAARARAARHRRRVETALAQLIVRLKDDPRALAIVRLVEEGVEKAAEQAVRLRCDVKEVYDANDRIQRHVRRIGRELPAVSDADDEEDREEDEVAE